MVIILSVLLFSTVAIASMINPEPEIMLVDEDKVKPWEPSEEDIAFQDSMYAIIERTQLDLDTIRAGIDKILYKLDKIEYSDGTYDSIRYVVGGVIDKKLNDEHKMWIGGNRDTIWE
tara:strand:- start:1659 stop:2009 length:351 start_codon:yes stop_codon:yes gene_type:complete